MSSVKPSSLNCPVTNARLPSLPENKGHLFLPEQFIRVSTQFPEFSSIFCNLRDFLERTSKQIYIFKQRGVKKVFRKWFQEFEGLKKSEHSSVLSFYFSLTQTYHIPWLEKLFACSDLSFPVFVVHTELQLWSSVKLYEAIKRRQIITRVGVFTREAAVVVAGGVETRSLRHVVHAPDQRDVNLTPRLSVIILDFFLSKQPLPWFSRARSSLRLSAAWKLRYHLVHFVDELLSVVGERFCGEENGDSHEYERRYKYISPTHRSNNSAATNAKLTSIFSGMSAKHTATLSYKVTAVIVSNTLSLQLPPLPYMGNAHLR